MPNSWGKLPLRLREWVVPREAFSSLISGLHQSLTTPASIVPGALPFSRLFTHRNAGIFRLLGDLAHPLACPFVLLLDRPIGLEGLDCLLAGSTLLREGSYHREGFGQLHLLFEHGHSGPGVVRPAVPSGDGIILLCRQKLLQHKDDAYAI